MDNKVYIDHSKLTNSISILDSINNTINSVDLTSFYENIEEYMKEINYKHDEVFTNKEELNNIYNNLNIIKRKTNSLYDSLEKTNQYFINLEEVTEETVNSLSDFYKENDIGKSLKSLKTNNSIDLTKSLNMELYSSNKEKSNQQVEKELSTDSIDTVPIGIAIGATGIIGSVGAVVLNEKFEKDKAKHHGRKDNTVKIYRVHSNNKSKNETLENDDYTKALESPQPYVASRTRREAEKYYGNDLTQEALNSRMGKVDYSTELQDIVPEQKEINLDDEEEKEPLDDFYE